MVAGVPVQVQQVAEEPLKRSELEPASFLVPVYCQHNPDKALLEHHCAMLV